MSAIERRLCTHPAGVLPLCPRCCSQRYSSCSVVRGDQQRLGGRAQSHSRHSGRHAIQSQSRAVRADRTRPQPTRSPAAASTCSLIGLPLLFPVCPPPVAPLLLTPPTGVGSSVLDSSSPRPHCATSAPFQAHLSQHRALLLRTVPNRPTIFAPLMSLRACPLSVAP